MDLISVDLPVPSRAAVDELIAQKLQPTEKRTQNLGRGAGGEVPLRLSQIASHKGLPVGCLSGSLILPKILREVPAGEDTPDLARKSRSERPLYLPVAAVKANEIAGKGRELNELL